MPNAWRSSPRNLCLALEGGRSTPAITPVRRLFNCVLSAALLLPGLAASAADRTIEAVVLSTAWSPSGIGGSVVMQYRPAVLYKDGSFSRDADRALRADARIDGRWQRDGSGFVLQSADGKAQHVPAKMRARPAAAGQTLEGAYRSLSGAGAAGTGVTTVAAFNTMQFSASGRVVLAQGAGASGGGLSTHGTQSATARYQLDGHTITVTHDNGQREQRLFYLFPDSDRAVGVGALSLSARR
jgi:hypothetical protein